MRQRFGGIPIADGAAALEDDRAGVIGFIHEVNGAAADLAPLVQHRLMHFTAIHALAAERGKKGGMDVERSAGVTRWKFQEAEPSSQANQVHAGIVTQCKDTSAEADGIDMLAPIDHEMIDAMICRALQAFEPGPRTDDQAHLCAERPGVDCVQQILQGCARSTHQRRNFQLFFGHTRASLPLAIYGIRLDKSVDRHKREGEEGRLSTDHEWFVERHSSQRVADRHNARSRGRLAGAGGRNAESGCRRRRYFSNGPDERRSG